MDVSSYNLMQLNGEQILKKMGFSRTESGNVIPKFELNENSSLVEVLESVYAYNDNAYFYQIKKYLTDTDRRKKPASAFVEDTEWNKDSLYKYLFYVNFNHCFTDEKIIIDNNMEGYTEETLKASTFDTKCYWLFRKGVHIIYNTVSEDNSYDTKEYTYLPFDKSSSMAREGRIIFIREDIFDGINDRIMLGIDAMTQNISDGKKVVKGPNSIQTNLSKLYAYRGLYLSNAKRIGKELAKGLELNESTVCVIGDNDVKIRIPQVFTARKMVDRDGELTKEYEAYEESDKIEYITAFDGEGLISPEYSKILNDVLHKQGSISHDHDQATSFQVRLPFTKGVLHEVDFKGFIKNQFLYQIKNNPSFNLSETDIDDLMIYDAFGKNRYIKDIQIVLTVSMFKGFKWMKEVWNPEYMDPMEQYFERVDKYDHALYIGNTNINLFRDYRFEQDYSTIRNYDDSYTLVKPNSTKMNYQFLNTLDLRPSDLEKIIKNHLIRYDQLIKDPVEQLSRLSGTKGSADISDESVNNLTELHTHTQKLWELVLEKNPEFIHHAKVKAQTKNQSNYMLMDTALGKLETTGSLFFLSHDLLGLLIHMIQRIVYINGENKNDILKSEGIQRILNILVGQRIINNKDKRNGTLIRCCLRKDSFYTSDIASLEQPDNTPEELIGYYSILLSAKLNVAS